MDELEFRELADEFIKAYRRFLLYAYMHKDVTSETYHKNKPTWNIIMQSLDLTSVLGFAKIFYDKEKSIGRSFDNHGLDNTRDKILNVRHELIAHFNSGTLRDLEAFLEKNQLNGSEGLAIVEALKNRFLDFEKKYKFNTDFMGSFRRVTNETVADFNNWYAVFKRSY